MTLSGQNFSIEINLIVCLVFALLLISLICILFSALVQINVLRYELIKFSDWSASTLEEISGSATEAIVSEVMTFRTNLSRADAERFVPEDVANAVKHWEEACDRMQARLARNGIKPLTTEDKQFLLSNYMK